MKLKVVIYFISLITIVNCTPKVCLSNFTCIEGTLMAGYQGGRFEAFMGIPFAQPPIGELRFQAPKPVRPWYGVIKAKKPKQDCIQKNYLLPTHPVSGSEDCLYMNIYRPHKEYPIHLSRWQRAALPVMVYIHGGGFFSGSANPQILGPEYFMDTGDVILITITYRLGPFGFLSTGDESISGNFGLKDQNFALKWVQKYIAAFGGDPNSVTIFGQSAGAVSVHLHILSEASKGLFHRAISMSGNALAPFATPLDNPLKQARRIAELCGISNAQELNSTELAKKLRLIDARKLIDSGDGLKYWDVDALGDFLPVIESSFNPNAFLTDDPRYLLRSGNYSKVPWLNGIVQNEGALRVISIFENKTLLYDFNGKFDYLLGKLLKLPEDSLEKFTNKTDEMVNYYFNGTHALNDKTLQGFVDTISDRAFRHPLYEVIKAYAHNTDSQSNHLYLYKFNYQGPSSYSQIFGGKILRNYGVIHCDDLIYLFRSPILFPDFDKNSTDVAVVHEFVERFVKFATTEKTQISDSFELCNKESIEREKFCSFTEFVNDKNSFKIEATNTFDIESANFWEKIIRN